MKIRYEAAESDDGYNGFEVCGKFHCEIGPQEIWNAPNADWYLGNVYIYHRYYGA